MACMATSIKEGKKLFWDVSSCNTYIYGDSLYWDSRYVQKADGTFDWYQRYSSLRPFIRNHIPTSSLVLMALIKSTNRLLDSLLPKDEPKLAVPLLLLIAQHRSVVLINADSPYIKMLMPSLDDLVHLYHLDPEVYELGALSSCCHFRDDNEANTTTASSKSESKGDSDGVIVDLGPPRWAELLDTVKTMLPSKAWNNLSPDLYATFWRLTLYDLYVPRNRYESEMAKQHAALKALEEFPDNSSSAINKRKKDKERIQEALDRLTSELHKHEEMWHLFVDD
ncbi:hypothetical protein CCACVL1_13550 [Corchorus capsularis]|uniref:THO complex subunitTHOC2 C-terminal domain-containing protein n=1 Tax=Corchorus capsularis TaxID=210143 RepID=A0A1R3IAN2_COCAP|nr:hypothetical protein CCACVL1_13550 [Corchorus capsularis]